MPYQCVGELPGHRHKVHEVVVSVLRYDGDHTVGETEIAIGGICSAQDALSVDAAEGLALVLHDAVQAARAEHPEHNTNKIDPLNRASTHGNVNIADTDSTPTARPT
jgi:hypothetical protein